MGRQGRPTEKDGMNEESIDITTPEGLDKANLKEVICTRCGTKGIFSKFVPVPDDYACIQCMETGILADDAGVLPVWDEKSGGR
jgi:formylmethanofuran dehydrogenase subunit E